LMPWAESCNPASQNKTNSIANFFIGFDLANKNTTPFVARKADLYQRRLKRIS
jgi:hypothetical protein